MIGKTNSQTGGAIKGEKLNISLTSNQSSHSDLLGAIIKVSHPGGITEYAWEGYEITVDVPPYVDYSVEYGAVSGYTTPAKFESTAIADNSRTLTAVYSTTVITASIKSNQSSTTDLANATITIGGKALKNGESAKFPTGTQVTAVFSDVTGYKTPAQHTITPSNASMTVSGTYQTTVLTVTHNTNQSSHSDVTSAKTTVKGTTVNTTLASGQSVKIPFGEKVTITPAAVTGYATPSAVSYTAADVSKSVTLTYNTTVVTVVMADNQSSLNDVANATATVAASGITTATVKTGQTVKVPTGVSCTVTWNALTDYKTPSAQTFTTSGASVTKTGTYQTELVSVTLNADNGASVSGAKVNINGKQQTWNGNVLTQKVPFGTSYTVSVGELSGFSTPASKSFKAEQAVREVSFTYIASALKVNILSNQSTDSSWDPTITNIKATVSYGSTTLEVSNGQQVNIPTDQEVTITFPSVTGYKTPDTIKFTNTNGGVVEKTGTYQTQLLTVNVTYSGTAPSGYTITGKDSGGNVLFTQAVAFATHKIPYGTSYTVSASKLDGYDAVADQSGVANSTSNTITMTYVHNPVKDLSKFDIYGNAISQTTANCYVVNAAGTYKIPLVFGNALKNGTTNSAAYTKNSGSYSHDFVDYNGTIITSPYIETVSGTATGAQLSIADTDGVFTDISIVDGSPCRYLQFKVNSVPVTGANGVLSIKNGSGVIMWSWHIWAWADSLATVEITNSASAKYKILPVNLASKWDDTAKTKIKNWFYQFGRPNPMLCPSSYNSTSNHASFGVLSYAASSIASNIQTGIKNPATFYKYSSSYNGNWFQTNSGKTYNLWDAACTSTGNSDNNVVKTIYDPCPIGFKMPNGNTFTYFSTSNVLGSFTNGWKFKRYSGDTVGVFFPASGYRYGSDGSLIHVGSGGYVWLSSAYSQNYAYYLGFNSSYVDPQFSNFRAFGFSVRPVQE